MEIIKVENLSTIFGTNVVHDNISFAINKKEIFGVLGGSGSGKSVLVKQLYFQSQLKKKKVPQTEKGMKTLVLKL